MSTALTVVPPGQGFSDEQIQIIKSQIAPEGTTDDELALFMLYCQRTGLDPFSRQIYLSERRTKRKNARGYDEWTVTRKPETTIDGFRLIAERTKQYAGQVGPQWCGEDGVWHDVWLSKEPPSAARVGILRHDFKEPLWAVAIYNEYCQKTSEGKPNSMWAKMPANQLAKCAESLGLRRAFPRELSGLYTRDEMPDERTEAREAQQAVFESRKAELMAKQLPAPAEVAEWADIDPEPVKDGGYEQRAQERQAEAIALVTEKKTRSGGKAKIPVSVEMLEAFQSVKAELRGATGDDTLYYSVLRQAGYEKSNEIPTREEGTKTYKMLGAALNQIRMNKVNREELMDLREQMGEQFWHLPATEGLDKQSLEALTGETLVNVLAAVREAAKGNA